MRAGSALRTRLLRRGSGGSRFAFLGIGQDDEHLFQARKIDRWLGLYRLIDAEVAPLHLLDTRHRNAARETATDAAGHEHVSDVDVVRALHVLDARGVLLPVPDAAY